MIRNCLRIVLRSATAPRATTTPAKSGPSTVTRDGRPMTRLCARSRSDYRDAGAMSDAHPALRLRRRRRVPDQERRPRRRAAPWRRRRRMPRSPATGSGDADGSKSRCGCGMNGRGSIAVRAQAPSRRPAGRRASASRRRHAASAPARVFLTRNGADLFTVDAVPGRRRRSGPPADCGVDAQARQRRARAPSPHAPRVVLDRRGQWSGSMTDLRPTVHAAAAQGRRLRAAAGGHRASPRRCRRAEAFAFFRQLLNYTPEQGGRRPAPARHVSRLRHAVTPRSSVIGRICASMTTTSASSP